MNTAVLFLVFNRPDTTREVFESIRRAKPLRLYIVADGPRDGRLDDLENCKKVREIISSIDWVCEVKTLFRSKNLGCKYGVSSAITWFFEQEEEGVILEDDVVPSGDFFKFCEYGLQKYRYNTRIMQIAGTSFLGGGEISDEYLYTRIISIWGWATWRRAWNLYKVEMDDWPSDKFRHYIKNSFDKGMANYLIAVFDIHVKNKIDTWDTQWSYACIANNGLSVVPVANLVSNIGIVGTHSSVETENHNIKFGNININNINGPKNLEFDITYENEIFEKKLKNALLVMKLSKISKKLKIHNLTKKLYSMYVKYWA